MKVLNRHLLSATALIAGAFIAASLTTGFAADAAKGAIGTTAGGKQIPTTEEARAAKLMPDDPNPVPGQDLIAATTDGKGGKTTIAPPGHGDPTTATGGQAAVGGPMSPGASAGGANTNSSAGASAGSGAQSSNQSGNSTNQVSGQPGDPQKQQSADKRPGPIGATGQTMPSLISQRNEILDRVPIMAMPMALTLPQRQRIYQTVMDDKSRQPVAGADALAPASILSTEQALNQTQPLPEGLNDIDGLKGLQYVKAKDKVLLVWPATRIVVDAITL